MLPEGAGRVRRRGIRAHVGLEHRTVTTVKGLRVTSIEDTWGDLTSVDGVTVEDLVVAADAIVCWKTCRDPDLLSRLADRRDGYPGVVLLREALPLVRTRSASPMESRTRLRFRDDGIPEPKLNAPVRDRHGQWLAEGDFVWEAEGVVADYDGAVHANPQLMRRDAARRSLITHADWTYEQITADTYYKPAAWAALIDRLRAKLT